jgi:hypothetical protein
VQTSWGLYTSLNVDQFEIWLKFANMNMKELIEEYQPGVPYSITTHVGRIALAR